MSVEEAGSEVEFVREVRQVNISGNYAALLEKVDVIK